jgi:hypothetical protein
VLLATSSNEERQGKPQPDQGLADGSVVTDHAAKATVMHSFYHQLLGEADSTSILPDLQ